MSLYENLCRQLDLGTLLTAPVPLTGGFLHRMVALTTTTGRYAVKLLNPHIMRRPTAMDNFRAAEALEAELERTDLPILPAKAIHGRKMHTVDGQPLYVFDYYDGAALTADGITADHGRIVGGILGRMHRIRQISAPCSIEGIRVDWDSYLHRLAESHSDLHSLLVRQRDTLYALQEQANTAICRLPAVQTICHNDMDPKNVLWHGLECRVIDLECLSYGCPSIELYETALCWSGMEQCAVDPVRFRAFIDAYAAAGGQLPTDWETVHHSNHGRLGWLEYNLKRALGEDCDPEEILIGNAESRKTLHQIAHYAELQNTLLKTL